MAVDLTTGSYNEAGIFNKYNDVPEKIEKSTNETAASLKSLSVTKILKECSSSKSVIVEGRFLNDDRPAIVVMEKMPFDCRDLNDLLTSDSLLELKFWNNIYGNYHVLFPNGYNGIAVQVIHPATEQDFAKFIDVPEMMITETKEVYNKAVMSYFKEKSKENHGIADDNLIYSDTAEQPTFVLLNESLEKCMCTSLHFRARAVLSLDGLLSLRDLTSSNVSLLVKLEKKCLEELSSKFSVPASKIESYVTYPPTTFPFHVIFETVEKDSMIPAEKAHSLQTVISNLQLIPDYYQRVSLNYSLPEKDPLLKRILEAQS